MNKRIAQALIILMTLIIALLFVLAVYGAIQLYTYDDRQAKLESSLRQIKLLTENNNKLELEIEFTKRCVRWSNILEKTLSPMEQYELDAMEERIKQEIQQVFKEEEWGAKER